MLSEPSNKNVDPKSTRKHILFQTFRMFKKNRNWFFEFKKCKIKLFFLHQFYFCTWFTWCVVFDISVHRVHVSILFTRIWNCEWCKQIDKVEFVANPIRARSIEKQFAISIFIMIKLQFNYGRFRMVFPP